MDSATERVEHSLRGGEQFQVVVQLLGAEQSTGKPLLLEGSGTAGFQTCSACCPSGRGCTPLASP